MRSTMIFICATMALLGLTFVTPAKAAPIPRPNERLATATLQFTNPKLKAAIDNLNPKARTAARAALQSAFFTMMDTITVSPDGILQVVDTFPLNLTELALQDASVRHRRTLVSDSIASTFSAAGKEESEVTAWTGPSKIFVKI